MLPRLPAYDQKSEALIPVLNKEIPLKAHAHQANDLCTALRIAREFDLDITLEHVTEGHMIVDELAKENVPLAVGPTFGHASKFELQNKTWETPGRSGKGRLPRFHHHRRSGDPAPLPALMRRPCHEGWYG